MKFTRDQITFAAAEVERQLASAAEVPWFLAGMEIAINSGMNYPTMDLILDIWAEVQNQNIGRFRNTPVTFASGGSSANHEEIHRLVTNLIAHGDVLSPKEWVREFVWIHPFFDGNGRMGAILFNLLNGTLDNPLPLPKMDFS